MYLHVLRVHTYFSVLLGILEYIAMHYKYKINLFVQLNMLSHIAITDDVRKGYTVTGYQLY